jgi:unsaturated chondroitin disaccharide hydrolase
MRRPAGLVLMAALALVITCQTTASAQPTSVHPSKTPATTSVTCPLEIAEVTSAQVEEVFALASRKLAAAAKGKPVRYPFGALGGKSDYQRTGPTGWTSGFFPGALWLTYQHSNRIGWLDRARRWTKGLLPIADFTGSHDLGFMVGIPTSLGFMLDPRASNRARYARAESQAARTLAERWNPRVLAIKSADYGERWGVIVDSAMNAPMLIEVGDRTGGQDGARLRRIGMAHMRTLARDFIREDGSTFHRLAYDPRTGRLIGPIPGQGLNARTSTWARGQAWAIAGFAQAYERTGDPQFLDAAWRTASYWMDRVPAGCVPAWDLDLVNPSAPRDSSALAIVASGMLHLADAIDARTPQVDGEQEPSGESLPTPSEQLRAYALDALGTLASPAWTTANSQNPGLLRRQTLSVPADPREGSYVWGDYYLLDALTRALRVSAGPT